MGTISCKFWDDFHRANPIIFSNFDHALAMVTGKRKGNRCHLFPNRVTGHGLEELAEQTLGGRGSRISLD